MRDYLQGRGFVIVSASVCGKEERRSGSLHLSPMHSCAILQALRTAHVPTMEIPIEPSQMTAATLSDAIEEVRFGSVRTYAMVGEASMVS